MPKKKNTEPTPTPRIDWNGSLADFKNVTVNNTPAGAAFTNKGATYTTPKNSQPAYTGPTVLANAAKVNKKGMFHIDNSGGSLASGFAGADLSKENIAKTTINAIMLGGGAGPIPAITSKVTGAVNSSASKLGVSAGVDYLGGAINKIGSKLPAVGGQIKQTAGTIYTQFGATPGKEAFIQMPFRTSNQVAGTIKGMITKESNVASKIANYSATTAKEGIKTGAKVGAAISSPAAAAIGYLLGKNKKDK